MKKKAHVTTKYCVATMWWNPRTELATYICWRRKEDGALVLEMHAVPGAWDKLIAMMEIRCYHIEQKYHPDADRRRKCRQIVQALRGMSTYNYYCHNVLGERTIIEEVG